MNVSADPLIGRAVRTPLSSPQREIWFDQMVHPQAPLYNIGGYMRVHGCIDPALFEKAVRRVVHKHDALRMVLTDALDENDVPMQVYVDNPLVTVPFLDFSSSENAEHHVQEWMRLRFAEPFRLQGEPLFRYALLKLADDTFYIFACYHHLIADGWTIALLARSLGTAYTALAAGEEDNTVAPSYSDFIDNDRRYVESPAFSTQQQYWLRKFQPPPAPLFAARYPGRATATSAPSACSTLSLPCDWYNRLIAFAREHGATTFHAILGAIYTYFTRTEQRTELVVGLPVLNRANAAFKGTAGLFVGVTAARFSFGADLGFADLMQAIGRELKQDYRHQRFPVSELNREVGLAVREGTYPSSQLFHIGLSYERHDYEATFCQAKGTAIPLVNEHQTNPLMLYVREFHDDEPVLIDFVYHKAYFDEDEIVAIQRRLVHLLDVAQQMPQASLKSIPVLTAAEYRQVTAGWNATAVDYPQARPVHELIERQTRATPDATALIFEERQLSYRELNAAANRLAHRLIVAGVGPDELVCICAERSIEMVVGLLAILKAGAAYVPLDPDYPADRLNYMLEDAGTRWLLTRRTLWAQLDLVSQSAAQLNVIDLDMAQCMGFPSTDPGLAVDPRQLAYTIYTSGSTGKPKGAGVPHCGLTNRLLWMQDRYRLDTNDRVLQKTPFSFDVSVWEFFWPLMTGAVLVVAKPGDHKDPARLAELIRRERITTLHFVPSMLQAFIEHGALADCFSLRQVMTSGEALPAELQQRFFRQSKAALHNLYGPTEASIDVTAWECTVEDAQTVPIGLPIANTQIYLLDAEMNPVPTAVAGELYIGGVQLARGYHGRPDLTAERFVPDPFGAPGSRLYRTGDLARWRNDGAIEYLGRTDHQVKIRGLRIELGEIEAALLACPDVREAVVVAREEGTSGQRLVAYLTGQPQPTTEQLRAHLQQQLPDYMVPSAFVFLDAMPLSPNGKIDRRALPAPDFHAEQRDYIAPRPGIETMLADMWADLFNGERISAEDNFFALGGHSLLAVRLVSRLRQSTGIELPLHAIFEAPVLRALAQRIETDKKNADIASLPLLADRSKPLPLSFAQQRLWFLDRLERDNAFYNMAGGIRLLGTLDTTALAVALNRIVARHEALRTCFMMDGDHALQRIIEDVEVPFAFTDLSGLPAQRRESEACRLAQIEAARAFDLQQAPMLRAHLLKMAPQEHQLVICLHHIAGDGWSMDILLHEMAAFYNEQVSQTSAVLAVLPLQYADFAMWQRKLPDAPQWEREITYWREQLADAPTLLELPADHARPAQQSYRGARIDFELPHELTEQLRVLGREQGATLFMTLLGAFGVLLSRYSGQEDVCVGTPIANRRHAEFEGLIGCFVNTLVMRLRMESNPVFAELLDQTRQTALSAYAHQDLPFEQLVDALQPERELSHSPLFQVMFALHERSTDPVKLDGLEWQRFNVDLPIAKFDLTLDMWEEAGCLQGSFEYSTDLFERATIERMIGHFRNLLIAIAGNPATPVAELDMLNATERRFLLEDLNRSQHDFPLEASYAELFAEQVARHPDRIAAVCMGESFTYRELDLRSTRIAHALVAAGAGPDTLVGVLGERSLCFLTMMIAIFKAGAAYVPLDVNHPAQRLREIVERGRIAHLLVSERSLPLLDSLLSGLDHAPCALIAEKLWLEGETSPLPAIGSPDDLAYVIFTSGSTGKPKGAMVERRGMLNNLYGKVPALGLGFSDRVAQTASPAFDISVWQFLAAPLLGGTVHIFPDAVAHDPQRLLEELARQQVNVLQVVPSMMRRLVEVPHEHLSFALRWILSIGEALPPDLAQTWLERFPAVPLINIYGPAECADNIAFHTLRSVEEAKVYRELASVPVGRPTANTQLFILDARMQPVPLGVPGEICVAGAGVGRGYLNDSQTTAKAFVEHPFQPGARFYRTGDRGRYRLDGTIDYLGRRDHQIKIRGQRIELGEIESRLRSHSGVREAIVIGRKDQDEETMLVAYWTRHAGDKVTEEALRRELTSSLPHYMVPAHFVLLDALPVNANGKVDRKVLTAMPLPSRERTIDTPCTAVEERLRIIWSTLLGEEHIGREDNFFHLGGHSLLATQLMSQIRKMFDVELPLRTVFEAPTLCALATRIEEKQATTRPDESPLLPADRSASLPLSFPQQRLWFLDRLEPGSALYNMPGALRLCGELNVQALEHALNDIVARHEVLRTCFETIDGETVQRIASAAEVPFVMHDLAGLPLEQRQEEAQRMAAMEACKPFDLNLVPLLRAQLLRLDAGEHWLLLTMHHIASDGWSTGILLRELAAFYQARCKGAQADLPVLSVQYADFAAWQRAQLQGTNHERLADYWRGQLEGAPGLLELPADHPRPAVQSYRGGRLAFEIDRNLTSGLHALSRQTESTLFMTLCSAYALLLSRYSGQGDLCIGTPVANRQRHEVENLIGFFVNTLVLRFRLRGDMPFSSLLNQVRETALGAYAHQDMPFEQLVEVLQPERHLSHSPLFQAMFALQNTPPAMPALKGLQVESLDVETAPVAKFDLTLNMQEQDGRLHAVFEFNADLFEPATIGRMSRHFRHLLGALVAKPETAIAELPLLSEEELHRQLVEWNLTHEALPSKQTIHELFEECVREYPHQIAAVFEEQRLDYAELNARANRLAHYLRAQGVEADELVGICVERSLDMVIAVLGVLKAGGAYLPLDPALPPARMRYMIEDARPRVLLTQAHLADRLPETGISHICLDGDAALLENWPAHDPQPQTLPDHLAYVIYTSGSTGTPKGTLIHHRGLVNLVLAQQKAFRMRPGMRVLQWASFNFDASVSEIFTALTAGARLYLAPGEAVLPGRNLLDTLHRHHIELVTLTPSSLSAMPPEPLPELKTLVVAGEHCDHALIAPWVKRYTVINAYGPTEATVCATVYPCADDGQRHPPIGRPIANTQTYILDAYLQPVPIGVAGELYIGGEGLARGYLGRPDLTAERFMQNPFSRQPGARMYKTGDLARYLPDGHIEYVGRVDHQVKIRGYRIELGEIEFALTALAQVREAAVLTQDMPVGGARLVACVVPESGEVSAHDLRAALRQTLPEYMVPAHFVFLDRLPVNTSGKIDRKALDILDWESEEPAYAPPSTATEQQLAGLWSELLGRNCIGRDDNFFHVGGHSLLAVRLMARVSEAFGMSLPLSQLFLSPTVAALAAVIEGRITSAQLVVPLKQGGQAAPVWLIHPAGGTVFGYRKLAERLGAERAVYAIQSPEIAGLDIGHYDFDALCRRYVAEMVRLQPEGPICLAGWSLGGALAFRMTEMLEQSGRTVTWVGMFDTMLARRDTPLRFEEFVGWAFSRVQTEALAPGEPMQGSHARVTQYIEEHGVEHLAQRLSVDAQELIDELGLDADYVRFLQQQYAIQQKHVALLTDFVPGTIQAPLHVFQAQESLQQDGAQMDWLAHTSAVQFSTRQTLPGHHENLILLEDNIEEIARVLVASGADAGSSR